MQNVLNFPNIRQKQNKEERKPLVECVKTFIEKAKFEKEQKYLQKVEFLKMQSYKVYLKRILKNRHNHDVVDIPDFLYYYGSAICTEAKRLGDEAVELVEKQRGRKHIEKCYQSFFKNNCH